MCLQYKVWLFPCVIRNTKHVVYVHAVWDLHINGIYKYPSSVKLPCMDGWASWTLSAVTLSVHIPTVSWARATHRESCPLSQWRKICVYVCVHHSVHNQCKGSGSNGRHVFIRLFVTFCLWPFLVAQFIFPNTAAEDHRRAEVWPSSREHRNGRMKEERENRGWKQCFCLVRSSLCILII